MMDAKTVEVKRYDVGDVTSLGGKQMHRRYLYVLSMMIYLSVVSHVVWK
jgi:hypothetical protein